MASAKATAIKRPPFALSPFFSINILFLSRLKTIRWVRAFIENYNNCQTPCPPCSGIKVWEQPYKTKYRTHILLEEERYIVVLENRDDYILLVTAFFFDQDRRLENALKQYEKAKDASLTRRL